MHPVAYSAHTRIFTIDPQQPQPDAIAQAAETLRQGGLVAFPTETVYGLGANALDAAAIDRIYRAKARPATDPIIAHIHTLDQLDTLARTVPAAVHNLAARFWPGALTLVLERHPDVPPNIAAGMATVAVRMPAHPVALALLIAAGVPVAAPSANTFTRPSATTAAHVLEDLRGRVDIVLDGGPTTIGLESTVLDLTSDPPLVLRPGGVIMEDLLTVLPDAQLAPRYLSIEERSASPGQMLRHYAPRATLTLYTGPRRAVLAAMQQATRDHLDAGRRVGVLVSDEDHAAFHGLALVEALGPRDDLPAVSRRLFAGLRSLDALGVDVILASDFGQAGLGAALWDRLLRAAEGRVVAVSSGG